MSYWSDERDQLIETIKLINEGAIRKSQENAELKEEIEKLKMEIKNLNYILESNQKEKSKYNFNQLFLRVMKLNVGRARVEPVLEILGGIAISVVIISGAWRLGQVDFSVGDFAGF